MANAFGCCRHAIVWCAAAAIGIVPAGGAEYEEIAASYCPDVTIDGDIVQEYVCGDFVVFQDASSPEEGVNLSAMAVWDEENLYFLAQMGDTYLNAHVEADDDPAILDDDCMQIFIDPDNSRDAVMQDDDFRIAVNVLDYVLDGSGWDNWEHDLTLTHALTRIATVNDNDDVDQGGSFIELAVPWDELGIEPERGVEFGLLFGTIDLDPADTPYTANHLGLEDTNRPDQWARVTLERDWSATRHRAETNPAAFLRETQTSLHLVCPDDRTLGCTVFDPGGATRVFDVSGRCRRFVPHSGPAAHYSAVTH